MASQGIPVMLFYVLYVAEVKQKRTKISLLFIITAGLQMRIKAQAHTQWQCPVRVE